MDNVRKAEHRKLLAQRDETLKGTKYDWMRNHPDLRRSESAGFRELHKINLKTSRAWQLKETFNGFWDYSYAGAAEKFFKVWLSEGFNSLIQNIKANARVLPNFANFRILFY